MTATELMSSSRNNWNSMGGHMPLHEGYEAQNMVLEHVPVHTCCLGYIQIWPWHPLHCATLMASLLCQSSSTGVIPLHTCPETQSNIKRRRNCRQVQSAGEDISRTATPGTTSFVKLQLHCSLMKTFALTYICQLGPLLLLDVALCNSSPAGLSSCCVDSHTDAWSHLKRAQADAQLQPN